MKESSYFTDNRKNMPFSTYMKVIEQVKEWDISKFKVLKLSLYGEPLLNPDFCEMLRVAREAEIAERIETTTNASLLSKKIAEKLVEYQLDYVRVSIYSPYQKRHEEITATQFTIPALHENLKTLQDIKKSSGSERPFVAVKMLDTYGLENDAFLEMYSDVADEMYFDKPHNWIKTGSYEFTDAIYNDKSEMVRKDLEENASKKITCPMAFTTMAVRSNGDVSPCCIDFIGGTNLGNVQNKSVRELWNSEEWYEFLKMQLENRKNENNSCGHCDFYLSSHYIKDNIDGFDIKKLR